MFIFKMVQSTVGTLHFFVSIDILQYIAIFTRLKARQNHIHTHIPLHENTTADIVNCSYLAPAALYHLVNRIEQRR